VCKKQKCHGGGGLGQISSLTYILQQCKFPTIYARGEERQKAGGSGGTREREGEGGESVKKGGDKQKGMRQTKQR